MELYLLFFLLIFFLFFTGKCHGHYLMCGDISLQLMKKEKLCTFANTVPNVKNATKMQNHLTKA